MTYDLETTIQLPDEGDVDVLIEFEVIDWGSPGVGPSFNHPGDPPEPVEFDLISVVRADNGDDITQEVLALSQELLRIYDLIAERIYELDQERGYDYDD